MSRKILKTLSVMMLASCITGLASCQSNPTSTTTPGTSTPATSSSAPATSVVNPTSTTKPDSTSATVESVIKSLTAVNEHVTLKVDETATLTAFYDLQGNKSLSAAQKLVTAVSDNDDVVAILPNGRQMSAKAIGKANITITSRVDTTKSCTFEVTVSDVYFDRNVSAIASGDDMSKELKEDGGVFRTSGQGAFGQYYVKGINSTKWYAETSITIHSVLDSEKFPKFGIVTNSTTATTETQNNQLVFFLDAAIGSSNTTSWTGFGICEVETGNNWAWNPGVTDSVSRHKDRMYTAPEAITYETKFKMGMARDGFDFHFWVNDVYAGSMTTLSFLFGNYNTTTQTDDAANSMVGFFHFYSDVTFEEYSATDTVADVDAKINAVAEKNYISSYDVDAA